MAKQRLKTKPERTAEFKEALCCFKEADEYWRDNRKRFLEDTKFARLGQQWPDAIRKQREQEGRPCLTINKLPAYIRQVVNDSRQNSPSIKVHPVDSYSDPETAEVLNGLIRNIEYTSDADVAYDTALEDAVTGGFGFFRIDIEYSDGDGFDKDLKICRIGNALTVYPDHRTQAADSSDWTYCFVTELITEEEHKERFPGKEVSSFATDDRDELDSLWFEEKLIRIAEYWCVEETEVMILQLSNGEVVDAAKYKEEKAAFDAMQLQVMDRRKVKRKLVTQRLMNGYEFLSDPEAWAGIYIPIVPVYGEEANIEGKRIFKGLTHDARDPQMMFNFWRTASTELVALAPKAPWIGEQGAFDADADKWATANTTNHAYIEYSKGKQPPQRQPFPGAPAGALQEALNASDDIKSITGIYDAAMGAKSNETSGRAILARKRESDVGTFHFIDNLNRAIRHAGRIVVDLIPKVYSTKRIIRTVGLDGENKKVPINQPHKDQDGMIRVYDLTTGKYDVTCEAGPSYSTQREEAADQMMQFVQAFPQAGQLIGDLIAKNMDWPGADDIAERLKMMLPPQLQTKDAQIPPAVQAQMQQMQQIIQQMQGALQQAEQKVQQLEQDKSNEEKKTLIDGYNAETNRLKAMGSALTPEAVQALVIQTLSQVLNSPDPLPGQNQNPPSAGFFMPSPTPNGVIPNARTDQSGPVN